MKEDKHELKECLNPVSCGAGKEKRGIVNEWMNDFVEDLSLT